jgi:hypothetical protein
MKKVFLFLTFYAFLQVNAQVTPIMESVESNYLTVFYDCESCDVTFMRQNLNHVEFVRDQNFSDVHVLISSQTNGSGGESVTLQFLGQHEFIKLSDTLNYSTNPNMTDDDKRREQLRYIEFGLIRFFIEKGLEDKIELSIKKSEKKSAVVKDPWNNWVYKLSASGWFSGQETYKDANGNFSVNAKRVTEKNKFNLWSNLKLNSEVYTFDDEKIVNNQQSSNLFVNDIISINDHWSYGFFGRAKNSKFSNYELVAGLKGGIEYDFFKYSESVNKQITVSYSLGGLYNNYYDTTVFNKTEELLVENSLLLASTFDQKWGSVTGSVDYQSYLNDLSLNQVQFYLNLNSRIYKGLSWRIHGRYTIQHNQINLKKAGVSLEEVLLQQQQLKSGYNYWYNTGLSYSFGSIYNSVVNPRFDF